MDTTEGKKTFAGKRPPAKMTLREAQSVLGIGIKPGAPYSHSGPEVLAGGGEPPGGHGATISETPREIGYDALGEERPDKMSLVDSPPAEPLEKAVGGNMKIGGDSGMGL
jgi:hypothetical protein